MATNPTALSYCCPDCGWAGGFDALDSITDFDQRVSPGELMPAGECPDCYALIACPDPAIPDHTLTAVAEVMRARDWIVVSPEPRHPGTVPAAIPFADAFAAAFALVVNAGYDLLDDDDFEGQDPGEVRELFDGALSEAMAAFGLEHTAEMTGQLGELILARAPWAVLNQFLIDTTE